MSDRAPDAPPMAPDKDAESHALDRSFASGIAWSGAARLSVQMLTWIVTVIVARLLAPADFGIVAAASVYLGLVRIITEMGFGSAIVAQRNLTSDAIAQLGGLAVLLGVLSWASSALVAYPMAELLRTPQLQTILPVLGFATAASTMNAIPVALLQRQLRFRALSGLEMLRAVASAASLLLLSWAGLGFWALVLNEIIATMVFGCALYAATRYRVSMPSYRSVRSSLKLGSQLIGSRLAWYFYSSLDVAIVSRTMGSAALGDYSMAWTLTTVPSEKLGAVIMSVTPGVLAQVQYEDTRMQRYFLMLVEGLAIILFPATIGIALVAPELVRVAIGQQWVGAIPLVQLLGSTLAIRSIATVCGQVLLARLRTDLMLKYSVVAAVIMGGGFVVGARWGVIGVAGAWTVLSPILSGGLFFATCKEIHLPLRRLCAVLVGPFLATVVMSAAVYATRNFVELGPERDIVMLGLLVAVGSLTYTLAAGVLLRRRLWAVAEFIRASRMPSRRT